MITLLPESKGPLLAFEVTLVLTARDYEERFIPHVEAAIREHGKASLVILFDEHFTGWDYGAMWDDVRFGSQHRNDFSRVAVVGGSRWIQWGTNIASAFMEGEVETFRPEQQQQAIEWAQA